MNSHSRLHKLGHPHPSEILTVKLIRSRTSRDWGEVDGFVRILHDRGFKTI
jgi:hypothetical protein